MNNFKLGWEMEVKYKNLWYKVILTFWIAFDCFVDGYSVETRGTEAAVAMISSLLSGHLFHRVSARQ